MDTINLTFADRDAPMSAIPICALEHETDTTILGVGGTDNIVIPTGFIDGAKANTLVLDYIHKE